MWDQPLSYSQQVKFLLGLKYMSDNNTLPVILGFSKWSNSGACLVAYLQITFFSASDCYFSLQKFQGGQPFAKDMSRNKGCNFGFLPWAPELQWHSMRLFGYQGVYIHNANLTSWN